MIFDAIQKLIWQTETPKNPFVNLLLKSIRILFVLARDFSAGQLSLRAMSLVYTTLLSFVPLLALSFSVLKAFGVHNQIEPFMANILLPLGEKGQDISANIILFVENMKVGVLGAVGLGLLIYTVISLIHKIEGAFNYIWKIKKSRPLPQRFSGYLSVIIISPVLAFSALGLTNAVAEGSIIQTLMGLDAIGPTLQFMGEFIPTVLTGLIFMTIYILIPNTRVAVIPALIAGVATSIVWDAASQIFSLFNASGNSYDAIYSGFAIIIIFMIWLYLNWIIVLLGASFSFYLQNPQYIQQARPENNETNIFVKLSNAQKVIDVLIDAQNSNEIPAVGKNYILKNTDLSSKEVEETLILLESNNYIMQNSDHKVAFIKPSESYTLQPLWNTLNKAVILKNLHQKVADYYSNTGNKIS